ncbi:MAG TPA: S41 family peptidase [Clostridia bacterium]|nr:S41 family peptidase [Clostridia bacterium]
MLSAFFLAVVIIVLVGSSLLITNFKDIGNLVKVITLVKGQYLWEVESTELVDGAIKGLVESLDDPYSVYLEPSTFKQLREQIQGSFAGLGLLVGMEDHSLVVVQSFEGTPAAKAGLVRGDIITAIDDKNVAEMDLETAVSLMRGPVGTSVKISVYRSIEDKNYEYTLIREEINVPTVEGEMIEGSTAGYIAISQFNEKTVSELDNTVAKLSREGMKGIILDVRNNPGGELNAAVNVASYFVPPGPIVYIDYRTSKDEVRETNGNYIGLPLVVLVNERSASASEILAGAIKDAETGTLVGAKTFGKGLVQTAYPLGNGAGLKLTVAKYLTRNKNDIHEKGVMPDIEVKQPDNALKDYQLEKALEIMAENLSQ